MKRVIPLLFLALVLLAGCRKNPMGPSPIDIEPPPPPPPDQSQYENDPIPTERRYLADNNGREIKMWAKLISIHPLRGSSILVNQPGDYRGTRCNPGNNRNECAHFVIELGFEGANNPDLEEMLKDGFFSVCFVNILTGEEMPTISRKIPSTGGTVILDSDSAIMPIFGMWTFAPTHLRIYGKYPRGVDPSDRRAVDKGEGSVLFFMDYKPIPRP